VCVQVLLDRKLIQKRKITLSLFHFPVEKSTSKSEIERHASLTKDFLELHKTLESEGYFTPSLPHVILRWMEIFLWYTAAIYFNLISWSWTSALLIGFGSARSGMLHHEAAHYSMTGNSRVDKFLGSLVMGNLRIPL